MRWAEAHARLLERSRDLPTLTASQRAAGNSIIRALETGVPYVNLWGTAGVGKTFLARHLAHDARCLYLSSPGQPVTETPAERWVIVDNVKAERREARAVYNDLYWQQAAAVVVITQARVDDSLFTVQLQLSPEDHACVRSTAEALFPTASLPPVNTDFTSLWPLVAACTYSELTEYQG